MPSKLVTRDVVKSVQEQEMEFSELIEKLRQQGYCASERALSDIGVYPMYVRNEDGSRKTLTRMT